MKAYTVSLFEIINSSSPLPKGAITEGIVITEYGDEKLPQIHLGSTGKGNRFDFCMISSAEEFKRNIKDGKMMQAFPIKRKSSNNGRVLMIDPALQNNPWFNDNIIVRVFTRSQRNMNLCVSEETGGYEDGVKLMAIGTGSSKDDNWDDALFTIRPHCAVVINKNGKPYLVVANSGGNPNHKDKQNHPKPLVMSWEEYKNNFQPHLVAKPTQYVVSQDDSATGTAEGTPARKVIVAPRETIFDGLGEHDESSRTFIPEYMRG